MYFIELLQTDAYTQMESPHQNGAAKLLIYRICQVARWSREARPGGQRKFNIVISEGATEIQLVGL
ncbi:hypothetical protein [Paenibacillus tundrae]